MEYLNRQQMKKQISRIIGGFNSRRKNMENVPVLED
jgi:hypothetical protein